jgi:hypothetical protein
VGAIFAAILGAAGAAKAQFDLRTLHPIEPGVGDLGPLGVGTRLLPMDLRQPMGFDRVFRVPGSSRGVALFSGSPAEERYARVSGAITAVFPRSAYVKTDDGVQPAIPGGTIYYIGDSPLRETAAPVVREWGANVASGAVDMRASTLAGAPTPIAPAGPLALRIQHPDEAAFHEAARSPRPDAPLPPGPPRNIFSDEPYRRARMRQLLMTPEALAR